MRKNKIKIVKSNLSNSIKQISDSKEKYVVNSKTDFLRNKKLSFDSMLNFLLQIEGSTIRNELMNYFKFNKNCPSASAFHQQRAKIKPDALYALFKTFTETFARDNHYKGYKVLAVDGSDIYIPQNVKDQDTYIYNGQEKQGWNCLHLHALYDITNHIYVDAIVSPGKKLGEQLALKSMVKKLNNSDKYIIIGDRGYESYQLIADFQKQGIPFIIRVKQPSSRNSILAKLQLPEEPEFDIPYTLKVASRNSFGRKKATSTLMEAGYKVIHSGALTDFSKESPLYTYSPLRIVKCSIQSDTQSEEYLITNLSFEEFSTDEIIQLYEMRWGIETSFRELKYALSLINFHSKKVSFIKQEIFARLTMYNFCHMITSHLESKVKSGKKHPHQINYTCAVKICIEYFRGKIRLPQLKELILRNTLPVRSNRSFKRKTKKKSHQSFVYRIS